MDDALLKNLIYITQVSLFAGIAMIIFAWVEKKILIEKVAHLVFVAMGILAAWLVISGQIVVPEFSGGAVPKEMLLVFYVFGLIVTSVFGLAAFIIRFLKLRYVAWFNVILVICALILFFMVYELIKG